MEAFRVELYDRFRRLQMVLYLREWPDGPALLAALTPDCNRDICGHQALCMRYTPALRDQTALPLGRLECWLYDVVFTLEKIALR